MFDRLIDLVVQFIDLFRFWCVVPDASRGVVLRLGRFHREIGPGFHLVWLFGIEDVWIDNIVATTTATEPQSLTTADGHGVVISAVITWEIEDIHAIMFKVEGREQVMIDCAYGEIAGLVQERNWDALRGARVPATLKARIAKRAKSYGIKVTSVAIRDLAQCRALRLVGAMQGGE